MAGGIDIDSMVTPHAERYDPDTGQWTKTAELILARFVHSATLLEDGRVLIAGGLDQFISPENLGELYDPVTGRVRLAASLRASRSFHSASILSDGRVLITGGSGRSNPIADTELYDYIQLVYPQLALGGGFEVILLATNQSPEEWVGVAQLDAGAWPTNRPRALDGVNRTGQSSFDIRLGPHQTQKFRLTGGRITGAGWLEVKSSKIKHLATSYFYNFFTSEGNAFTPTIFEDSTGVGVAGPVSAVRFPVERSTTVNTGLAIRNSRDLIDFTLYDQMGNFVETKTISLEGGMFFSEIFSAVPQNFIGSVRVGSTQPFYLTVLRQELIPGDQLRFQLTSVPATPVP